MSDAELKEMNVWIAENAMGWRKCALGQIECGGRFALQDHKVLIHDRGNCVKEFSPTTDPASAMLVLEKIVAELGHMPSITTAGKKFVWANPHEHEPYHDADTLCLAIALFSKQLFSK